MIRWLLVALGCLVVGTAAVAAEEPGRRTLAYAPAPVDNPLKGLVPYAGDVRGRFPHSLEFNYLPLAALVVGEDRYDWSALERLLDGIAARGHQAVFRVYLEYPGKQSGIPAYLMERGLKVHRYTNTNTQPFPSKPVETPDYENADLRRCLTRFIAALGKKYDGDPRIGFITAGLLGTWGEWHTYPRNDLWASKAVQIEVLDAYEAAFRVTPVLVRYPAGPSHAEQTSNVGRRLGYHDDSFAWATLDTGKKQDSWFFVPALKAAGPGALERWQTQPIGGEIRPEAWGKVFAEEPGDPRIQDFGRCVRETHVTWLMDSGMFRKDVAEALRRRAETEVRRMGYEFHIPAVTLTRDGRTVRVGIEIENRGVAPFYYDWRGEVALLAADGRPARTAPAQGRLTGLLPGQPARRWTEVLDAAGLPPGTYHVALRVPNSLPNGPPVRMANDTQDKHAPGWLTLGDVTFD